jgi:hypothetical protein
MSYPLANKRYVSVRQELSDCPAVAAADGVRIGGEM